MFSNYSSTSMTWTEARDTCAKHINSTSSDFNTTIFHLLALESLGETISLFYFLKGGDYNHSFWTEPTRTFGWRWDYAWNRHRFVSHGFLGDGGLKTNTDDQNHMYLKLNSSAQYEFRAANLNGDKSIANEKMGYICEASVPCKLDFLY